MFSSVAYSSDKPVTAVITYSPGGGLDQSMRHFEKYLLEKKKIPLVFTFKPGAESLIGSQFITTSPKDGSVIGFTTLAGLADVVSKNKLEFDYVSATRRYATVMVTNSANTKITDFNSLGSTLKNGDTVIFGVGTPAHKIQFNQLFFHVSPKVEQIVVPFKGAAPVVNALLGNHIEVASIPAAVAKLHIESGKLKVLSSTIKIPEYKDLVVLPQKYKDWLDMGGYCIILPRGTDPKILEFWRNIVAEYLTDSEVISDFTKDWSIAYQPGEVEMKKNIDQIIKELAKIKD